jgi:serine/threonine-protein kinase
MIAELAASDPAAAGELAELLRADGVEGSFLDRDAAPWLSSAAARGGGAEVLDRAGTRLGAWRIGEPLGQGGMGTVYRAERADGAFEQAVAIKVLRRSVDTPELERRFVRERQLLARLDHPAIVKVLDGGLTPEGLPWFALERVDGLPITRYAAERHLGVADCLRLTIDACEAVEAAHRRLIVHRDLKPSNLLVTAEGRVKLLDFGIAKVLEEEEGEALTRTGARLLTPQYAAPEQILGEPVTTAVDVYALGAILYELVTGSVPHRRATTSPAGLAQELARETTRPPSRRLLEPGAGGAPRPARARELAGDLDAVILKALRPEPAQRYASVADLSADLRRHLEHRPVEARAGDRRYRLGRFLRRHRAAAIAAGLVALALAGGGFAVAREARVARAERDQARIQAETARRVSEFMAHLFQQADPARTRGAKLTVREVLAAGAGRVERDLGGEPQVQASLRLALGAVERDLGLYDEARPLLERALAQRRALFGEDHLATAEALYEYGSLERFLDRMDEGRRDLERALAIRERELGPDHLDVARAHAALGVLLRFAGDPDAARGHLERALAIAAGHAVATDDTGRWLNSLGLVEADLGRYPEAEAAYRRGIAELEATAGADNPLLALPLDNLGMLLTSEERFPEAEPILRREVDLVRRTWGEQHSQFGNALNSLGGLLMNTDRCGEAIPLLEQAAAVYAAALGAAHRNVSYPLIVEADCYMKRRDGAHALPLYRRATAIREQAAAGTADGLVAQAHDLTGAALAKLGRLAEAERELRRAVEQNRAAEDPQSPQLAESIFDLAECLARRGGRDEARALYGEALAIFRKVYPGGHSYIDRCQRALAALE